MQKVKVLCLILAIALASAGTVGIVMGLDGDTVVPIVPDNALNTVKDKPEEGTPADCSAIDNLYIAQGELQRKGGFVGTTRGTTTSAGIKQDVINNRVVSNGNVFKEMITVGVVKNAYQLFMYEGNYLYRQFDSIKSSSNIKWADTASKYSESDFLEKFGHRSDSLTGYILNNDTIVSGELEKEGNGLYQYRYVLNIETAPAHMLREMKTNSNMNGYSTFTKAEIVVVMDKDWQVKTLTTDCKYKVPMFGGVDCVEDITETFSDLTSQDLPEMAFFQQFFNAEVQTPVEKDPDALSILMDMFSPYIGNGNSLNASITAINDGQTVLNGLVSAKVDIDNLDNIEVAAKLGNDLFVEYRQGNVFVTYQDFKASTTVDGIMGAVNALMPKTNADAQAEGDDDLLSKFTYEIVDGVCTVSLPLQLGEEKIELNIYANVTEGGYDFTNAVVMFGSLQINVELTSEFAKPEREGEYPEILGLLDLVHNGVIYGNVDAFGINADVMFDIATLSLYATSDNLSVIYQNNAIYAELGAIKVKLNASDFDRVMTLLRLSGIIDGDTTVELPQISLEQIISLLGDVKATATAEGVEFGLVMGDLSASIHLVSAENGWNVDNVAVAFGENVITLAVTMPTAGEIPEVDDSQYADVMTLLNTFVNPIASLTSATSYGSEFNLDLSVGGRAYNVAGSFAYDANKNIRVNAIVSNDAAKLVRANIVVANGVVYLDVNGLKTAFSMGETSQIDLSQIISAISGINDDIDGVIEAVYGIFETVKNFDVATVDVVSLIKQFSFIDGELALTVNADFVGLDDIRITLSVSKYNNLVASIEGLSLSNVTLNASATVISNIGKVKIPNASDYVLNLSGSVDDIQFAVSADLLNMDISASVDMFDQTILLRYVDDKVYLSAGEIAVVGKVSELIALVEYVMSEIGAEGNAVDFGNVANVDLSLETLINAISVNLDGSLSMGINLDGIANVSVNFDDEANFVDITAEFAGHRLEVVNSDKQAEKLDTTKVYIPVEALTKQIAEIYNNYKNVLNTGISANLNANVTIEGVEYGLSAVVNYNGGLYLNVTLADNCNVLAVAEIYFVNNTLYAEVNGIRVATKLPETDVANNANVNLVTLIGLIGQAKGYNDVLDSVIAAIEQLPAKLDGINYLELLSKLIYDDGTLSIGVNGEMLGLSDFELTVAGTKGLTAALSNLTIGNVTVASFSAEVLPVCNLVTAPTSEYVTELQLEVKGLKIIAKLDLYNKTVVAKTTLLNHELGLCFANEVVYVSYGAVKAKLDITDIDKLIAVISNFIDGSVSSFDMPELNVKQIVDSLSKAVTDSGYDFNAVLAGVNVTLSFNADAKFTNAFVSANDFDVKATLINGATYPAFDFNAHYVDLAVLVQTFAGDVQNLKNADGYDVTLNGSFAFDNCVYDVQANVIYNGGLYVNANVSYNTANMLNAELWLVDNTLYVSAGDLKLAIATASSTSTQKGGANKINLSAYKGYNPYVDGILDVVQNVIDKFVYGNVDYISLIDGLTLNNGELILNVNGEQLGLSQFSVKLGSDNGMCANVSNLVIDTMTANLTVGVIASATVVTAPQGDFTTNLSIRIDDQNTVFANLDLINKVYNFRLDDMYVMYADNTVYINKGDLYVSGNINQIIEYVKRIDDLVNEFSGAEQSTMASFDFDMFKNIDVKAIVNSLTIDANGEKVTICVKAFGFDVSAILAYGKLHTASVPVSLIDKTLEIEPCKPQTFDRFDGEQDYIQIEQVFNDYFPAFERLVHTNSWVFRFDGDTLLTIDKTSYKVASGSYFEFYFKNTEGMDTFKLRAKLDVYKQKADGGWQPYMNLDIMYRDGNIYVTDTGRLVDGKNEADRSTIKITVSVNTLIKCYGLYDEIVAVVPQIGDLVNKMLSAMSEAENNAENISYSTILTDISYVNGLFGLDLNGSSLLSKLGAIALSAQTYGEGLSLNSLDFTYDNISLQINNLRVYASELEGTDGKTEYVAVNDINSYNTANHIDFNSLYELLSSFVITATPIEGNDGARSFFIEGSAFVKLSSLAELKMGLAVKVDITADNYVNISAKIHRSQPTGLSAIAYKDKGGDSYLNYNSLGNDGKGSFTVIRDSMKKVSGTHKEDVEERYYYCTGCDKEADTNLLGQAVCPTRSGLFSRKHDESYLESRWRIVKDMEVSNTAIDSGNCVQYNNLTTDEFTAGMIDYLLEMLNLSDLIANSIRDAIKSENSNDFGIEDLLVNYEYSSTECKYYLNLDLTAIDSNLGAVGLNILHNSANDFSLTNLNANMSLLKGMCDMDLNMTLKPSVCGETTEIVKNNTRW